MNNKYIHIVSYYTCSIHACMKYIRWYVLRKIDSNAKNWLKCWKLSKLSSVKIHLKDEMVRKELEPCTFAHTLVLVKKWAHGVMSKVPLGFSLSLLLVACSHKIYHNITKFFSPNKLCIFRENSPNFFLVCLLSSNLETLIASILI